jgi:hypothetical protein
VLPENGDRIQSSRRVLKEKQDDILDKDNMMDNVLKRNICFESTVERGYNVIEGT